MPIRVRNKDGELSFTHFADLEKAYREKWVDPDDEVLEDGASQWRAAGSIKLLAQARPTPSLAASTRRWYFVAVGVAVLGAGVVWMMSATRWMGAAAVVLLMLALSGGLTYVTYRSLRKKPNL